VTICVTYRQCRLDTPSVAICLSYRQCRLDTLSVAFRVTYRQCRLDKPSVAIRVTYRQSCHEFLPSSIAGHITTTRNFRVAHRKKSGAVSSGNHGGIESLRNEKRIVLHKYSAASSWENLAGCG
jgi:hypothetical protein